MATPEAPQDDGSGMITRIPPELGFEAPAPAPTAPSREKLTSTISNNRRTPVLGLPEGMSVEAAHVMAEEQNAARAAAEAGQTPEQQQ